jgi:hypothetical protein
MGEMRDLFGKPKETIPVTTPRCRWKDNIKIVLKIQYEGVNWIRLAQDMVQWLALVNTVMNLRVP